MASEDSDESAVEVAVDGDEVDIGFPGTDLILVVEGRQIHVNKNVLCEHSPVFNTMFNSNFKEGTAKEIVLQDKKATDVVEFLKCFYPNMEHPITEKNVLRVLPLAHEYQSPLVEDCENFMIAMCKPGTRLTVSTLLDYILAGEKYDLTMFLETAVAFCARINFHVLNGKSIEQINIANSLGIKRNKYFEEKLLNPNISLKFSKVGLKTQFAIAKKRVQLLEMNTMKRKHSQSEVHDHNIQIS
nr:kelch-like protein 40 [Crassostrea gigas]